MVRKSKQLELALEGRGEAPRRKRSGQAESATAGNERPARCLLMERVVAAPNMKRALKRVRQNKGSPGIDQMTVAQMPEWLRTNWQELRAKLLAGTYQPQPIRRALIPKRGGGERELGIPTVVDRLIQQALLQVLQPRIDPTFSEHSHGFRPGRRAHDAVRQARQYVQDGKRWVVDIDLERFFDRVNHDVLMGRMAKRIEDRKVLGLIRRYLNAGAMADGVATERLEGTPQGGPLSPLLANVLLDEVDQELEVRGHAFVRYADDLRVFVGSKKAGQRVMHSLTGLFGKLRLKVNQAKSAVDRAWKRPFLGFSLWVGPGRKIHVKVADKALETFKDRVRQITNRNRGRSMEQVAQDLRAYLLGWKGYFQPAHTPKVFESLDGWIRHRLRAYQLKQWKRATTVFRDLTARGMGRDGAARVAKNARRWWRNSAMAIHRALPNTYFDALGVPRLAA